MSFSVVDSKLNSTFQEIRRRIRRLQCGGTLDSIQHIGGNTENHIGASYVSLKNLAGQYQPDEKLALLLWSEKKREEQIIACFLMPENINKEKNTQLIKNCISYEVASYLGSLFLFRHMDFFDFYNDWLNSGIPYMQTASLTAIAKHLIIYKENSFISKDYLQKATNRKYDDKYVQLIARRYRFNI